MTPTAQKLSFMTDEARAARVQVNSNRELDRAAASYKAACHDKAKALAAGLLLKKFKTWDDLGIPDIPFTTKAQPLTFGALQSFLAIWCATAADRFKLQEQSRRVEVAQVSTRFETASTSTGIRQVGRFKLRPRQYKALDAIIEAFQSKRTQAVVCPLEGGEGKSVIAWGYLKYYQDNNFFGNPSAKLPLPNKQIFATAAPVVIDMRSRGRACSVTDTTKYTTVLAHTSWNTKALKPYFREIEVEVYGVKVKKLKYIMPGPFNVVIDEFDAYKKRDSAKSKFMLAVVEACIASGGNVVFFSATPWAKIDDTWLFCIATGKKWQGEQITMHNFPNMAQAIASRAGASRADNSPKAMEEFRKEFNDCFVVPPRDPKKVRAYNKIKLVEFKNAEHRAYYDRTIARYQEELERCGQEGAEVNKMTVFLKLRQSEEWLKTSYFVDLMMESHGKGFAPVCGVSFQASVNEIVRGLVERGVPRSKISVIQGGDEIVTREKLAKIIGPALFDKIGSLLSRFYKDPETLPEDQRLTPKERTAVRKYMKWIKERARNEESAAEQGMRQEQLIKLKLGKQSLDDRHAEKERFQNGDTEFMVFTLSAGGRGIDMDQQFEGVRPREGFFTICYWMEEFLQALYRLMRVATLSDVHQHMVFFANTIVADHVAPRLDKKIKSCRAGIVGKDDLADETIDLLMKPSQTVTHIQQGDLRDGSDTVDDSGEGDADADLAKIQDDDDDDDDDNKE